MRKENTLSVFCNVSTCMDCPAETEHSMNLEALLFHYAKADSKKEEVLEVICILHLELNEALFWRKGQLFLGYSGG